MSTNPPETDLEGRLEALISELEDQQRRLAPLLKTAEVLEESGLLDLVEVLTAREEDRSEQLYEAFTEDPANLRAVQNLSLAAGVVSELDPDQVAAVLGRVREGHDLEIEVLADPPRVGLWGGVQQLQDPDVQRGLGAVFTLLKMIGSRTQPGGSEGKP